jgi:hypothetical protein
VPASNACGDAHSRSISTCFVITTLLVPAFHRFFSEYATRPSGSSDSRFSAIALHARPLQIEDRASHPSRG